MAIVVRELLMFISLIVDLMEFAETFEIFTHCWGNRKKLGNVVEYFCDVFRLKKVLNRETFLVES